MASSTYKYSYESQLTFMFNLIGTESYPDETGFTIEQKELWAAIIENRERLLQTSPHQYDDPAKQQYKLEEWTWNRFWPETPFPGSEPTKIEDDLVGYCFNMGPPGRDMFIQPSFSPPPSYQTDDLMPSVEYDDDMIHPSLLSPTRHYPTILGPSILELRAECRNSILQYYGENHVPFHGWDDKTGLPRYSIICTASNGFLVFCGPRQNYYRALKGYFYGIARIMYQRARSGLMVIWIEALSQDHVIAFRTDKRAWNEFKSCYAFLKCWADAAGLGQADCISDFLQGWQQDSKQIERLELEFPPSQVVKQYGRRESGS